MRFTHPDYPWDLWRKYVMHMERNLTIYVCEFAEPIHTVRQKLDWFWRN